MTPKEEQKHTDLLPLKYDGKRIIDAKGRTVGDMRTVAGKELSQAMVDAMNTRKADCHDELYGLELVNALHNKLKEWLPGYGMELYRDASKDIITMVKHQLPTKADCHEELVGDLQRLRDQIDSERGTLIGDGYNYTSGEESGMHRAVRLVDKALARATNHQESGEKK